MANSVNMAQIEFQDLLETAREHFKNASYKVAESLLQQLVLMNTHNPEVHHMLASIYYDQGKFNKAIKTFKRALEIDPQFIDAAVGLSIILNDLGRYEEGKQVFHAAQKVLDEKKSQRDPYIQEKLAAKHDELGEMYFQYKQYQEAITHYEKALELTARKNEIKMKLVECYLKTNEIERAVSTLKQIIATAPQFTQARLKLGLVYYKTKKFVEAIEQWESVLLKDPQNAIAKRYLQMTQESGSNLSL